MNKLRKVTLSFILSLLLITGVMPAGTTYSPVVSVEAAVSKKQTAKFVKAVDGDTAKLSVKGRTYTFRFLAVDTPETVKPNTPVAFMGKRASDYTKSELKKAKKIQIQYDGNKTDKYGRKLAWIWVDGKLLQDKLVKKGYARIYYIYGKYKNIRIYYKNPKRKQERKNSVSGRTIVLLFLTVHHPRILQHQRKNQIIMSGYLGAAANITLMLVAAV